MRWELNVERRGVCRGKVVLVEESRLLMADDGLG
jgi:hypothetical protein